MTTDTLVNTPNRPQKLGALETILIGSGIIFLLTAFGILLIYLLKPAPNQSGPGIAPLTTQDTPIQNSVHGEAADPVLIDKAGTTWTLTPRATYAIGARVLGNKTYHDWQAPIIPRDLALAWGKMSDPAVDEWIHWRQSGRWYYYNWDGDSPYKGNAIRDQSANVHIIPATENLAQALQLVHQGDVVYLKGRLVDVEVTLNGREMYAQSSLTRKDSGAGACEIFYVEQLIIDAQVFE